MNILKSIFRTAKESRTNSDQCLNKILERSLAKERKIVRKEIDKAEITGEVYTTIYLNYEGRIREEVYYSLKEELLREGYAVSKLVPIGNGITKFTVSW